MIYTVFARCGLLPFAVLVLLWIVQGTSWAQQAPVELSPEKARQFLDLFSDPEVKAWLEAKVPASAEPPGGSSVDQISRWEAAVRDRIGALAERRTSHSRGTGRCGRRDARDVNSGRPGLVVGILAVLIAVGFGAEWLVRRALPGAEAAGSRDAGQAILSEIAALLTFTLASVGSFLAFEWPPLLRRIVLTLLLAFIVFRVVRAIARLLFAFVAPSAIDQPARVPESDRRLSFLASAGQTGCRLSVVRLGDRQPHARLGLLPGGDPARCVSVRPGHSGDSDRGRLAAARQAESLGRQVAAHALPRSCFGWPGSRDCSVCCGSAFLSLVLPTAVRGVGDVAQVFAGRRKAQGRRRRRAQRADRAGAPGHWSSRRRWHGSPTSGVSGPPPWPAAKPGRSRIRAAQRHHHSAGGRPALAAVEGVDRLPDGPCAAGRRQCRRAGSQRAASHTAADLPQRARRLHSRRHRADDPGRARRADRAADCRRRHFRRRHRLRLADPGQGRAERRVLHDGRRLPRRRIHPERQLQGHGRNPSACVRCGCGTIAVPSSLFRSASSGRSRT